MQSEGNITVKVSTEYNYTSVGFNISMIANPVVDSTVPSIFHRDTSPLVDVYGAFSSLNTDIYCSYANLSVELGIWVNESRVICALPKLIPIQMESIEVKVLTTVKI